MATISQAVDHLHQVKESLMEPHNNEMMHHWLKGPIHPPGIPTRTPKEDNVDCQHPVLRVAMVPVHVLLKGSLHSADPMDSIGVLSSRPPAVQAILATHLTFSCSPTCVVCVAAGVLVPLLLV